MQMPQSHIISEGRESVSGESSQTTDIQIPDALVVISRCSGRKQMSGNYNRSSGVNAPFFQLTTYYGIVVNKTIKQILLFIGKRLTFSRRTQIAIAQIRHRPDQHFNSARPVAQLYYLISQMFRCFTSNIDIKPFKQCSWSL